MQRPAKKVRVFVALVSLVLVTVFGVGCDEKATPKKSLCRRVCERMSSCGKVLKYEDEFNDPAKCARQCQKDFERKKRGNRDLQKCLEKTRCRPFLACVLGAATKKE